MPLFYDYFRTLICYQFSVILAILVSRQISASTVTSISSGDNEVDNSDYEDAIECNPHDATIDIMTPDLAAALDRTNTTSRNATYLFAAFLKSVGLNPLNYNISKSAIHRNRITLRGEMNRDFRSNLELPEYLVVGFDGKMLKDVVGVTKVERVAIVLTGLNTEQLLGIPKLTSGSGINTANAVLKAMEDYDVTDCVKGLCFDTTSVNTGNKWSLFQL